MTIDLLNTYKYWKDLTHQNRAIQDFEKEIRQRDPSLLQNFAYDWRKQPDTNTSTSSSSTPLTAIINRMKELGIRPDSDYLDNDPHNYRLTIIGLEGVNEDFTLNDNKPDQYNDLILGMKLWGNRKITITPPLIGTVSPGAHYTKFAMNKLGAGRLVPNMKQPDIWKLGRHFREPDCLIQTGGPVTVYRDANKDFDFTNDKKYENVWGGFNFHHNFDRNVKSGIGKTSAGCIVPVGRINFYKFINEHVKNDIAFKKLGVNAKFSYVGLIGKEIFG